jgi:hypothetical protein
VPLTINIVRGSVLHRNASLNISQLPNALFETRIEILVVSEENSQAQSEGTNQTRYKAVTEFVWVRYGGTVAGDVLCHINKSLPCDCEHLITLRSGEQIGFGFWESPAPSATGLRINRVSNAQFEYPLDAELALSQYFPDKPSLLASDRCDHVHIEGCAVNRSFDRGLKLLFKPADVIGFGHHILLH